MEFVKRHESTSDSQQVYVDLEAHHTTSITATTRANNLFEGITATVIPETCRESLEKCIITKWKEVREYNSIATTKIDSDTQFVRFKHYTGSVPE